MRCRILHVSGSQQQITAVVIEAVNEFIIANAEHAGGFSAYYAGPVNIASTDVLDEHEICKKLEGIRVSISGWHEHWHHIFVDCREPKITVAGWYDGAFYINHFPHCETRYMPRPPPHPLAREVQFIAMVRGINLHLYGCKYTDTCEREIYKTCKHEKEKIRFVYVKNGRFNERCIQCFGTVAKRYTRFICGTAQPTEFTMTGEGRHGEYTVLNKDHFKYNLVGAKIIVLDLFFVFEEWTRAIFWYGNHSNLAHMRNCAFPLLTL
jgi:hypothetical protein